MTHKTTQQQPAPGHRNQAAAETDEPQTAVRPGIPTAFSRPSNPDPSGTGHAPCKDRNHMTRKTTQQQPTPYHRTAIE